MMTRWAITLVGAMLTVNPMTYSRASSVSAAMAEKLDLKLSDLGQWPSVGEPKISNDGRYFSYSVQKTSGEGNKNIFVQALDGHWKLDLSGLTANAGATVSSVAFSADSDYVLFQVGDDLCQIRVGTQSRSCFKNVAGYKSVNGWLAIQLKGDNKELVVRHLKDGRESRYKSVAAYWLNDAGTLLTLQAQKTLGGHLSDVLEVIRLPQMSGTTLWSAPLAAEASVSIDNVPASLAERSAWAFSVTTHQAEKSDTTIWYYGGDLRAAQRMVDHSTKGFPADLSIATAYVILSKSGKFIIFFGSAPLRKADPALAKVDVWSYRDSKIQESQPKEDPPLVQLAIGIDKRSVFHLDQFGQYVSAASPGDNPSDEAIICDHCTDGDLEFTRPQPTYSLFQLTDRTIHPLDSARNVAGNIYLSSTGRFVVFYDGRERSYFSYNVATGKTVNIAAATPAGIFEDDDNEYKEVEGRHRHVAHGPIVWVGQDKALLVGDNYDLWKLDPLGLKAPINVTNAYGRTHGIRFKLMQERALSESSLDDGRPYFLMGYERATKQEGIYRKENLSKGDPEILSKAGGLSLNAYSGNNEYEDPLKARDVQRWIVTRQSATEAPNYFSTRDFKTYTQLTDLEPQRSFNWLTAELIQWKNHEREVVQGILYKPEEFDPKKKYPVLFNYYERRSQQLYAFRYPEQTLHNINIPWFISRGYLVVVPDIVLKVGEPGPAALSAVESAAQYLSQFPWVDPNRLGIQGHSFGGYETNYIVSHSDLFAAACSASGVSNWESFYGAFFEGSETAQGFVEQGQGRMGVSLWQDPDQYHRNSPIYALDRIKTPLLIMANKADTIIYPQQLQVFLGLRRLDKKVWMLQYDEGDHSLNAGKDGEDFTVRITQFFDYYLQDKLPPKWMTEGVPARLKGVETGLQFDTSGAIP